MDSVAKPLTLFSPEKLTWVQHRLVLWYFWFIFLGGLFCSSVVGGLFICCFLGFLGWVFFGFVFDFFF